MIGCVLLSFALCYAQPPLPAYGYYPQPQQYYTQPWVPPAYPVQAYYPAYQPTFVIRTGGWGGGGGYWRGGNGYRHYR